MAHLEARPTRGSSRSGTRPATCGRASTATTTRFLIVGSHIDAVPDGGWLDGALGLMTALETVRQLARAGARAADRRPVRRLGRRGGRAVRPQPARLLGVRRDARSRTTSATCEDADGVTLGDALAACGVDLDAAPGAAGAAEGSGRVPRAPHRAGAGAARRRSAGLRGERDRRGRAAPDDVHRSGRARRVDADAAAPGLARGRGARGARDPARARSTTAASPPSGGCTRLPASSPPSPGSTEMQLDQRHLDPDELAAMLAEALEACRERGRGVQLHRRGARRLPRDPDPVRRDAGRARADERAGGRRRRRASRSRAGHCTTRPRSAGSSRRR